MGMNLFTITSNSEAMKLLECLDEAIYEYVIHKRFNAKLITQFPKGERKKYEQAIKKSGTTCLFIDVLIVQIEGCYFISETDLGVYAKHKNSDEVDSYFAGLNWFSQDCLKNKQFDVSEFLKVLKNV